jgi:predicted PurR-regulated permease PerM
MKKKERKERLIRVGIWSGGIVVVLLAMYLLRLTFGDYITNLFAALNSVIIPAAISVFVLYLVKPVNDWLLKRIKSRGLSALISVALLVLIFAGFFLLVLFLLTDQVSTLVIRINEEWPLNNMLSLIPAEILDQITNGSGVIEMDKLFMFVLENLQITFAELFSGTLNVFGVLSHWMLILTLTPVFLYFFLTDGEKIFKVASTYIPKKFFRDEIVSVALIANESTGKYMRGKMLSILALSLIFSVFFSVTFIVFNKMPLATAIMYGVLFAIIISILDLVPFVGPLIGIILPLGFTLILSQSTAEFLIYGGVLLALDILAQELQKGVIEPVIMSNEVSLHPIGVLMGMLFFGALFGFAGFILATPLVSTIHSARLHFIKRMEEEESEEEDQRPIEKQIVEQLEKATAEIKSIADTK